MTKKDRIKTALRRSLRIRFVYEISGVFFVFGILTLGFFWFFFPSNRVIPEVGTVLSNVSYHTPLACTARRPLDGLCLDAIALEPNPNLVAVMIENHTEARPQFGLADARVVYEAPVEGNFTRFLVLFFAEDEVAQVGPVRSARPYYLDWVSEYPGAMYMHVGGSPKAMEQIEAYGLFDMNEFYRGWYFWRGTDRVAPHNVYTASRLWQQAESDYGSDESAVPVQSWRFTDMDICINDCAARIDIVFSLPHYTVSWRWNTTTEKYERWQAGAPHVDAAGNIIVADTVVVQFVETTVLDVVGRLDIKTVGSGPVSVFRDGYRTNGIWNKKSRTNRTRFFDDGENEIPLKPGTIWVEAVNPWAEVWVNGIRWD